VKDPLLLHSYQQTATRKNWADPTREEIIRSLNKGHTVNRALEKNLNKALAELFRERRWRRWLMLGLGAAWAALGFMAKIFLPYAIRGMAR
jgi:hypothetical protein